jgi:hypothetical protein
LLTELKIPRTECHNIVQEYFCISGPRLVTQSIYLYEEISTINVIHHIILLFRKGHGMQIRSVTDNSLIKKKKKKKKKKKIIIPKSQLKVEKKKQIQS